MPDLHLGILVVLGIAIVGGAAGAWLFQKLKFPQVVGYIIIGVLIGQSGFRLVSADQIEQLGTFNLFALGVIGFLVGGELHMDIFRKYGKQFMAILLGEGLAAFVLVMLPSALLVYWITRNLQIALASGILFGAIASATDPASTLDVLWENRSRGTFTTAVIAIVALDDALAMTLYGLGTGAAQLLSSGGTSMWAPILRVMVELLGAILLGVLFGFALNYVVKRMPKPERALGVAIGVILLSIGIAAGFRGQFMCCSLYW